MGSLLSKKKKNMQPITLQQQWDPLLAPDLSF